MKTLTANAETQRLLGANAPRWIVQIDWGNDGSWTGKYADQPLTISGDTYEAYVQQWGSLRLHLDYLRPGSGDDIAFVMKNDDSEDFWSLCVANEAEGKPVRVGMWFVGLATVDIEWMFVGHIQAISEHSVRGTKITCVEFGRRKQKPLPLRDVNRKRFPTAPASSIGRMIPIVFGRVRNCPGVPVFGYTVGREAPRLYDPHAEDDTTIRLTNLWGIKPAGTVLIGAEQIHYSGTTWDYSYGTETVAALLGCTRGYNSTTASAHADSDEVIVASTHYVIFADHACDAMFSPMVEDRQPASEYSKVTNGVTFRRDTSSRSSYVSFTDRPPMYRVYKSLQVLKIIPTATNGANGATDPENARDEIEANSFATVDSSNTPLSLDMTTDLTDYDNTKGAVVKARAVFEYEASDKTTVELIAFTVGAL